MDAGEKKSEEGVKFAKCVKSKHGKREGKKESVRTVGLTRKVGPWRASLVTVMLRFMFLSYVSFYDLWVKYLMDFTI